MVKRRLIPKLLVVTQKRQGIDGLPVMVTTRAFSSPRLVGSPVSQAKIFESQLADELIVLNIARKELDPGGPMIRLIRELATQTFMPLTVGGGVRCLEDFETLLQNGADKVAITTAALEDPDLVTSAAKVFGSQCVVVGLDCVGRSSGDYVVAANRARELSGVDPVSFSRRMTDLGAGELLVNDVARDGSGAGLNVEIGRQVVDAVDVPVILSGGAGLASHFAQGFTEAGAEAVAAGTFFAFRDQNPMQTRSHVANAGVPIRMLV